MHEAFRRPDLAEVVVVVLLLHLRPCMEGALVIHILSIFAPAQQALYMARRYAPGLNALDPLSLNIHTWNAARDSHTHARARARTHTHTHKHRMPQHYCRVV